MFSRYVAPKIAQALADTPVVYVMGARQVGKTTLAKQLSKEQWGYVTFDDETQLRAAQQDPIGFIRNLPAQQMILDEVQRIPQLFLAIKQSVDEDRRAGRFLLTGSTNALLLPTLPDSLAGRMESITLEPLSRYEIEQTIPSNDCFLAKLLRGEALLSSQRRIRDHLIQNIVMGGFPEPIGRQSESRRITWYQQYLSALILRDVNSISQIKYPELLQKLVSVTCIRGATLLNSSEVALQIGLDKNTTHKYLGLLKQLFIVQQLPAWHTNEYKRLVKMPKIHPQDTGLSCALRNINAAKLKATPELLGTLAESFVLGELRKQSHWLSEVLSFYHYRDKDQLEVDIVIETMDGRCFGVEVKIAASLQPKDFHGLKKLQEITKDRFEKGVLLYDGDHPVTFNEKIIAIPFAALWS